MTIEVTAASVPPLDQQEVLATFPEFNVWLRLDVTGGTVDQARAEAQQILDTVRTAPIGDRTSVPTESFIGHWNVHDGTLDINGEGVAKIDGYGGARVVETDTLTVTLSPDGHRLDAVVTAVQFFDSAGRPTASGPGDLTAVGDTSYFEFAAPHLLREMFVKTSSASLDIDFGNPYWCGAGLDQMYVFACGA